MEGLLVRGFAAIGLDRIKNTANLGGVLRAAGCFGAKLVLVGGGRMGKYAADTMRAYKQLPCIEVEDILAHLPYATIPIVIEITERARNLSNFVHPENA